MSNGKTLEQLEAEWERLENECEALFARQQPFGMHLDTPMARLKFKALSLEIHANVAKRNDLLLEMRTAYDAQGSTR